MMEVKGEPATFQQLMYVALRNLHWSILPVYMYLNDIAATIS